MKWFKTLMIEAATGGVLSKKAARGAYLPGWAAFAKVFDMPKVNPVCLGFREQWHYILAWAYRKCCLDTTHKWKVTGDPPTEVRWLGGGKLLLKERMVDAMWVVV